MLKFVVAFRVGLELTAKVHQLGVFTRDDTTHRAT